MRLAGLLKAIRIDVSKKALLEVEIIEWIVPSHTLSHQCIRSRSPYSRRKLKWLPMYPDSLFAMLAKREIAIAKKMLAKMLARK